LEFHQKSYLNITTTIVSDKHQDQLLGLFFLIEIIIVVSDWLSILLSHCVDFFDEVDVLIDSVIIDVSALSSRHEGLDNLIERTGGLFNSAGSSGASAASLTVGT